MTDTEPITRERRCGACGGPLDIESREIAGTWLCSVGCFVRWVVESRHHAGGGA